MNVYILSEIQRLKKLASAADDMELCAELSAAEEYLQHLLQVLPLWEGRAMRALLHARLSALSNDEIKKALGSLRQGALWD